MSDDGVQNNEIERAPRPGGITGAGWMKGESGNPSGRPRSRMITKAIRDAIENDPEALAQIVSALIDKAKGGDLRAFSEIADRLEGKAVPAAVEPDGDDDQSALVISLGEAALAMLDGK